MVPVHAEIVQMGSASAHADYEEMLAWLSNIKNPPRNIFITHGEARAALALKEKIEQQFQWNCSIPIYLEKKELT